MSTWMGSYNPNGFNGMPPSAFLPQMKANATAAGGQPGTAAGLASMATNFLGGLGTGSAGLSLLSDAVGGVGTMVGNQLMKGISGGGSAAAKATTDAGVNTIDQFASAIGNHKSDFLQNTNAMGQQGTSAALEMQRRMNSQMEDGADVAAQNRTLGAADSLQQNALGVANQAMRQQQMTQQNMRSAVMNMRGGNGTANLGALQGMQAQNAQGNLASAQQGAQGLQSAAGQQIAAAGQAANIRNQGLASNFSRNVDKASNNWENMQGAFAAVAGPGVSQSMSESSNADNASYNALGTTAGGLGAKAGKTGEYETNMLQIGPIAEQYALSQGIWGQLSQGRG